MKPPILSEDARRLVCSSPATSIRRCKSLTANAKHLLALLVELDQVEEDEGVRSAPGVVSIPLPALAEWCGASRTQIVRRLAELENRRVARIDRSKEPMLAISLDWQRLAARLGLAWPKPELASGKYRKAKTQAA